jgi:hypothetical protein
MNISQDEAVKALQEIEASRAAMRSAIRSHRGHLYLWLWGCAWIAMSVLNWMYERRALAAMYWISGVGMLVTFAIGYFQGRQIRTRIDRRFVGVCITLLAFGYLVWPAFFGGFHAYKAAYAYCTVLWMQLYVVAGIWFDNYLLWIGITVTVLVLATFLLVPSLFWALTLLCGVVLLGTGFYVRFLWR